MRGTAIKFAGWHLAALAALTLVTVISTEEPDWPMFWLFGLLLDLPASFAYPIFQFVFEGSWPALTLSAEPTARVNDPVNFQMPFMFLLTVGTAWWALLGLLHGRRREKEASTDAQPGISENVNERRSGTTNVGRPRSQLERLQPMKRHVLISLAASTALGVLVTFLGYAELVAAHPDSFEEWSPFARFAIPLSAIGPDGPSYPQFFAIWLGNILLWVAAGSLLSMGLLHFIDKPKS